MEYEVIITRSALRDLEEIRAYIARDDPAAAQRFGLKLLDEAESLRIFPERGGFIAERPGARFVMVYPLLGCLPDRRGIAYGASLALLAWSARADTNAVLIVLWPPR